MMDFVQTMMDFEQTMMDFVQRLMDFVQNNDGFCTKNAGFCTRSAWNILDALIVFTAWIPYFVPVSGKSSGIRAFRLLR